MRYIQAHGAAKAYRSPKIESLRKKIVSLVFVIYWLLIFEGVFRKWVFPEYHKIIFFVRDPFVLMVYFYALKGRFFSKNLLMICVMLLSFLIIPIMLFHFFENNVSFVALMYGWRNYFFYIPLAFLIGDCFRADDFKKWLRQNLLVSVPMAVLVFYQFVSPPDAYINKGIKEDGFVFQVVEGVVRTTGTFTFTAGYALYAASIFSLLLACWLKSDMVRSFRKSYLLLCGFVSILMISLSGSRTVFVMVMLVVLAVFASALFAKETSNKRRFIFIPVVALVGGGLIFAFGFTDALNAIMERQTIAVSQEGSTLQRAFNSLYQFTNVIGKTPLFGYGIGFGTNGATASDTGSPFFRLAEDESTRTYLELGPIFFIGYFAFRIILVAYLIIGSSRAARYSDDPLPFLLLGFIGMTLLNGPMTMQGTINGYAWFFCGFCLAAIKLATRPK